jgi:hypothetical protein
MFLGLLLVLLEKCQSVEFHTGDFLIFGPMVWKILNFELFSSLKIQLNYKKKVLEGEIS